MPPTAAPPRKPIGRKKGIDAVLDAVQDESTFNLNEASDIAKAAAATDSSLEGKILKAINSGDLSAGKSIRLIRVLEVICPKPTLLAHLLEIWSADSRVRSKVTLTIGRLVQNSAWLREQLVSSNPQTRANAVEALGMVEVEGVEEHLVMAAYDVDPKVIAHAAVALRKLGRSESITICQSLLRHEDRAFRSAGLWAASQMGDPRFLTVLHEPTNSSLFDEAEQKLRAQVIETLKRRLSSAQFAGELQMKVISSRFEGGKKLTVALSCVPSDHPSPLGPKDLRAVDFIVQEEGHLINSLECKWVEVNEPLTAYILIPEDILLRADLLAKPVAIRNPETLSVIHFNSRLQGRNLRQNFTAAFSSLKTVGGAKHLFLIVGQNDSLSLVPGMLKSLRQSRIHVHTLVATDATEEVGAAMKQLSLETGGIFAKAASAQTIATQLQSVRAQHASISELTWRCKTDKPEEIKIRCVTGFGYGELAITDPVNHSLLQ